MDSGKIVLGVLAGVAIGAVLGVLFAPDKGEVTRKKIAEKGGNFSDELHKKLDDFIETMKQKYEESFCDDKSATEEKA